MVEDRNLITGQNPNSAIVLAERLLKEFAYHPREGQAVRKSR
jgi:putative intracellular protease/amidase